jgi:ATP-dependent Clp protease ATP-binding subunit ClpA
MYDRFTSRARKILQLANQEAQRAKDKYIGSGHILLGMLKETDALAGVVLRGLNVSLDAARKELAEIPPPVVEMPPLKRLIGYAYEEAQNLHHHYIGTEHLLLGLLREEEGAGALALKRLGLPPDFVRAKVLMLLGKNMQSPQQPVPPGAASEIRASTLEESPEFQNLDTAGKQIALEFKRQIERLTGEKESAVAIQDFDLAAQLRDRVAKLKRLMAHFIAEWLNKTN